MPTTTVLEWETYCYYPGNSGYINVPFAAHRDKDADRGTSIPNSSFYYPLGSGNTIASYDAWCSDIKAAGIRMIRLIWGGRNLAWGGSVGNFYDLEPPPYGTYHVFDQFLDDSSLTTFRSNQVSGSPGDPTFPLATWNNSNIKELFEACDTHHIEVIVELSHNTEFGGKWSRHAWNYNNYYVNGNRCEVADRGFLYDNLEVYTDPQGLAAFKNRIKFVIDLIGSYQCVCMWGIMSEGNWTFVPSWWGRESLDDVQRANIRNYIVPFYQGAAEYIRSIDVRNRPIMTSVARTPTGGEWSTDPDAYANIMMEPLTVYPVDIVGTNLYQGDYEEMVLHINVLREKIHPKRILIHQYWPEPWILTSPWVRGASSPTIRTEYAPYLNSKRVEWIGQMLKWGAGPGRWSGLVERAHNVWDEGGYADPNWYSIGGVTENFRAMVDWMDWANARDWADYVSSPGLSYSLTTGDRFHLVGLFVWGTAGSKSLTVSNLANGTWTWYMFNWTDGVQTSTDVTAVSTHQTTLTITPSTYNQGILYGVKD